MPVGESKGWLRILLLMVVLVVVLVSGVARAASPRDQGELYVAAGREAPVDISRSAAADVAPSIAPHGERLAFWSNRRPGHEDLYLVSPDGSGLTRVVGIDPRGSDVEAVGPITFAGGGAALYTSYVDQAKPLHPTTIAFRVDVDAATAVRLPWCAGAPVPARSGGLVACPIGGVSASFMPTTNTALWRRSRAGGATRIATVVGVPLAWTPDSRELLVRRRAGLAVSTPGSGQPVRTIYRGDVAAVSFPRGSKTVLIQDPWTHRFRVSISGGAVTQLASYTRSAAVVSATGRRAYLRYLARSVELVVTGPDGRDARVVAHYDKATSETLTWFPTGDRLLVSTVVTGRHAG